MAIPTLNTISLCSGVGMLDLGLHAACEHLGIVARTVAYVEREAYAASQLVALMESECLDAAPVWSDLSTFDGRPWRGVVDCLIAGLPCQPYSVAGAKRGLDDKRSYGDGDGPIPHALRIIGECRPAVVWLENVPPWVRGGFFRPVGEQLSRMGYEIAEPLFLAASDVGASHKRERVFILAFDGERGRRILGNARLQRIDVQQRVYGAEHPAAGDGMANTSNGLIPQPGRGAQGRNGAGSAEPVLEHATNNECERNGRARYGRIEPANADDSMADTSGTRLEGNEQPGTRNGNRGGQKAHGSITEFRDDELFAPGPSDPRWPDILRERPDLAPATESGVRMLVDGLTAVVDESRRHQLRCIGNGVVPEQASAAFIHIVSEGKLT